MAIGRISGSVLKSNLTRNGVDLAFETNLLYLDVTNSRVGIGTSEPSSTLHVSGDTTTTNITTTGTVFTDRIQSTGSNQNLVLDPQGTGTIDVNSTKVTSLATPTADYDAATKKYVDDNIASFISSESDTLDAVTGRGATTTNAITVGGLTSNGNVVINGEVSSADSSLININDGLNVNGVINANASGNSILVADTLRIAQTGSGLRMTNVGAFDNDGSDNFRIFGTNDLSLHANGSAAGTKALSIDATNKDVRIHNDLIADGSVFADSIKSSGSNADIVLDPQGTGTVNVNSTKITNVTDPTSDQDAATKAYVDAQVTASDLDFTADDSTTNSIDLDSEVMQFSGGTGITTSAINNTVTTSIDSTVATLTGTQTLENKTLRAPTFESGTNSPEFLEQRFVNATQQNFVQLYTGGANGSYFTEDEYQKIATITPDGNSQNYTFIIRMTATSASNYQIVTFSGALRSNTLPDLSFTTNYFEEHNGTRFIEPKLWTKETSTAGFILAFKYIHNANLYGGVNVEATIIPRSDAQRANVSFNTTQDSEITSIDTGFTENDPTLIYANVSGTLEFGTQFRIEGSSADGNELTITATNPTADRTATFPDATGNVVLDSATQTLTNKTLTSPTINSPTITSPTITGAATATSVTTNDITSNGSNANINIDPQGTGNVTVNSNLVVNGTISTDDSTVLTVADNLRVTGLTTDNAFLINAGNGQIGETTTLTVDPDSNYLGINQTSPEVTLHMTGEGAQSSQIRMEQYNDSQDAPDIRIYRRRGTIASPADVQTSDYLFRINVHGQDGGTGSDPVYHSLQFDVDSTDQDAGTVNFETRDTGGNSASRLFIDSSGQVRFGTSAAGYTFPSSRGSNGQALITDGSGNLSFGSVTSSDTLSDVTGRGASTSDQVTLSGGLVIGGNIETSDSSNINFADAITANTGTSQFYNLQVNNEISLGGAGSQYLAFNEDSVKVKFANWYSSNDRQYGQGQLWYEMFFAAVDSTDTNNRRRIGFYLDTPNKGATNAEEGSGAHPNNHRAFIDNDSFTLSAKAPLRFEESIDDSSNIYYTQLQGQSALSANRTITLPDATGTVVLQDSTDTLTNKTIALGSNTVSGTTAQFNSALSDGSFATLAGSETLTNKTLTTPTISGEMTVDEIKTSDSSALYINSPLRIDGLGSANETVLVGTNGLLTSSDLLAFDTGNNRVGIGTTSPATKFHIAGEGTNEGQIRLQQANNGSDGPDFAFYSSRGTISSPSASQSGDTHGRVNSYAHNGTSFVQSGSFGWSGTDTSSNNTFDIKTRVSGTIANRIEVTSTGLVQVPGDFNVQGTLNADRIQSTGSNADIVLEPQGTGVVTITSNIVPDTTTTYDIGTSSLRFNDIYLAGSTVDLGGTKITKDSNGDIELKDGSDVRKKIIVDEVHIGSGANKIKLARGANGKLKKTNESDVELPILTVVGDDSTGTDFNTGEDIKVAGAGGITTAVSGDTLTITGPSGTMSDLTDDTSPQLGGNLDLNSNNITGTGDINITGAVTTSGDMTTAGSVFTDTILPAASNSDLALSGAGTGTVSINDIKFPTSDGSADQFLKTDGSGQLSFGTVSTTSISEGNSNVTVADTGTGSITVTADNSTIGVFNTTLALNLSTATNAIKLPSGTTAQRPTGAVGMMRYNSSNDKYEVYTTADGWLELGATASDSGVADSGSSATGIGLNATNIDTFTTATYDSAWYYAVTNDEVNGQKATQKISLVHDNSDAYVSTSHMVATDPDNDFMTLDADISSGTVRLRGTGATDTNSISFYRVPLGDNTTNTTSGAIKNFILEDTTNSQTEVNTYTTTGESTAISSTQKTMDNFAITAFDSAWYLTVHRDETNADVKITKYASAHNGSNAFVTETGTVRNDDSNAYTLVDADVAASKFRLRGTATSATNSMTYYRIALGDSTTAESVGAITTAVNTDVDSAAEQIDSWAHASYRGAKYYVSAKNSDSSEVVTSEATVVHDGTTAYISQFNSVSTTSDIPMSLTADIDGSNVVLKAAFTSTNWKVTLHRTLLADSQSNSDDGSTSTQGYTLANTTTSSTATEFDNFTSATTTGAFYVVTGYNSTEGAASISEVHVVTDGSDAYLSTQGVVNTKGSDQLSFTATYSSGTVSVKAASTSGASTVVSAYKVQMLRGDAGLATIDTFTGGTTNRAAKYYFSVNDTDNTKLTNTEALVVHDGTNAYITQYGTNSTSDTDLITLSAEYDSGTVKVKAIAGTSRVTGYRILLQDDQTASSTDDTKVIAETTGVSSSATEIDTFETDSVTGAFYVVAGYNSSEGTASASEVMVVTGGTSPYNGDVFVGAGPTVSTKASDQLDFSATISGTTVSVKAASTSGASTNVTAYRVNMLRGDAGTAVANVTVAEAQTVSGAKTFSSAVALQVVGSAPSVESDKGHIYAKDVNVGPGNDKAEIFVQDELGNETRISPHNAEGEWEYFSRNIKTGKTVRINMEEMIRDIEKLTGKSYIKDA